MPLPEKATQTLPPSVSTRSNESAIFSLTASLQELGSATASDLQACDRSSTSEREALQLRQVRRCSSTAVRSTGASSRVLRASILVNTDLHCIGHSPLCRSLLCRTLFQRIPQQLEGAEHFAAQRGLGGADGSGDLPV